LIVALETRDRKGKPGLPFVIVDFTRSEITTYEPFTKRRYTVRADSEKLEWVIRRYIPCYATSLDSHERARSQSKDKTILGRESVYTSETFHDKTEIKSWVDPSLHCLLMEEQETFEGGSHNQFNVLSIEFGTRTLDEIGLPGDSIASDPWEINQAYAKIYGSPRYEADQLERTRRTDVVYHKTLEEIY
jgi:hypothetical protein